MTDHDTDAPPAPSTASLIASHGFAVKCVGYGVCSVPGCRCRVRDRNPWTYTAGLSAVDLPELVLMGLEPGPAHFAVSWIANQRRGGHTVAVDQPLLLEGVTVKVLPVPDEWVLCDTSRMAAWFEHFDTGTAAIQPLPVIHQVVWADAAGRFPDDPRCAQWVVREQPILRAAPLHHPQRWVTPRHRHRR